MNLLTSLELAWSWRRDHWALTFRVPGTGYRLDAGQVWPRRGGGFVWDRNGNSYAGVDGDTGRADDLMAAKAAVEAPYGP